MWVVLLSIGDLVLRRWIRVHSEEPNPGDAADKGVAADPRAGAVPDRFSDLKSPVSRAAALVQERDPELVEILFPPNGHRTAGIGRRGLHHVSHRTDEREGGRRCTGLRAKTRLRTDGAMAMHHMCEHTVRR